LPLHRGELIWKKNWLQDLELEEEVVHIGELRGSEHAIAGSLYAVDDNILLLKRFEYDGEAKDPFFWVGTSGDQVPLSYQKLHILVYKYLA
jgi:hypothetical protein